MTKEETMEGELRRKCDRCDRRECDRDRLWHAAAVSAATDEDEERYRAAVDACDAHAVDWRARAKEMEARAVRAEALLREAYDAGWGDSGEGHNGQYTRETFTRERYETQRRDALARILVTNG